jgi:type IV pilus assembly protein PilM
MAHPSAAWGIEIGQFAIKAIRLERDGDGVRVTDFSVLPHRKVLSTPDIDVAEVTRLSLGQLISEKSLEGDHLVISVPGHSAFARFAKLPPVEKKDLPEIVKFEAVQQIPFPIEEVEWDYEAFQEDGSPEVEVGIFAITRERVNERLDVYGEVGLSPETLTLSPVALFNAMNYDLNLTEAKTPIVFIDIGTQATDVIIATGDRCWIRTFPLGGTHFTEAIASTFKISYAKAERLKQEAASSKYAKQIMQAMRPVFADLLQELQRSLSYASASGELNTMVGLGSTFKIPGLRKFIGQQLQVNVTRLDEFKKIDVSGRDAASFAENCVNMGTAYGLALQGVGLSQIDINLVPSSILREHMWHSKTKWFVAAACIIVAGSALSILGPMMQERQLGADGVPREVKQVIDRGEKLKRAYDKAEQSGRISNDAAQMISLFDYRDVWPYIVQDSADALAAAGPDNRTMHLADFLNDFPTAGARPLVQLNFLSGVLTPSTTKDLTKITVSLEVNLSHDEPVEFLNTHVAAWLRAHTEPTDDRKQVPYRIVKESVSCNPAALRTMVGPDYIAPTTGRGGNPSGGGSGGRGGGSPIGGGGSGGRGGGSPIGGGGSGGRGGGSPIGGGGSGGRGGGGPIGGGGSGGRGGGGSGGGTGGGTGGGSGGSSPDDATVPFVPVTASSLNVLAPLPEHTGVQLHQVGETWYRALVTFDVEVLPQPRETGNGSKGAK